MSGKHLRVLWTAALLCMGLTACNSSNKDQTVDDPATVVLHLNDSINNDTSGNADSVDLGKSVRLTWSSANANFCTASGGLNAAPWKGSLDVNSDNNGVVVGPLNTVGSYTFTLSCTGAGGGGSASKTVVVGVPAQGVQTNLFLSRESVRPGQSAVLTWNSTSATSCTASGTDPFGNEIENWKGTRPIISPAGGQSTGPVVEGTYTYMLTCIGAGGSDADTKFLTVSPTAPDDPTPVPAVSVFVSPSIITTGNAATIQWSSANVSSCTASGDWSGAKATFGTQTTGVRTTRVAPYQFILDCTGPYGPAHGVGSLQVVDETTTPAPTVDLKANGAESDDVSIAGGASASLTWTSSNATSCTASGGWTGDKPLSNAEGVSTGALAASTDPYSYTLSCTGAGGTSSDTVTITATGPGATVDLKINGKDGTDANPVIIPTGGYGQLSWTTVNATTCTATASSGSDFTGSRPTVGTAAVHPVGAASSTITYTLTCDGGGHDSVVVKLGSAQASCNIPQLPNAKALLQPYATPAASTNGLCVGCSVAGVARVVDADLANFATISVPVGLLGASASVTVTDNNDIYPGGSVAGVILSIPGQTLLTADVVGGILVQTLNNQNQVTATTYVINFIDLYLLGALDNTQKFIQGVTSPTPFSKVRVSKIGLVSVLQDLSVYAACVQGPALVSDAAP